MFAQPRISSIKIDAPAPMEMFERDKIHPDNAALDKSQRDHDPRMLPRKRLRKYQRAFDAMEYALERAGMLHFPDLLYSLRDQFRQAKVDYIEAESDEQRAALRATGEEIRHRYRDALAALDQPISGDWTFWERRFGVAAYAARLSTGKTLRQCLHLYMGLKARLDEHESAVEYRAVREQLRADMDAEARLFADIIIDRWTQLGLCYTRTVTRNGKTVHLTDRVRFQEIVTTEDEIHFKILSITRGIWGRPIQHMPRGLSVTKLLMPDVLKDLTHACEREVTTPHTDLENINMVNGAWLTVHRLGAADSGLLKHVPLEELWHEFPRDMAHLMPLPVGVKRGRLAHFMPLVNKAHFLIAGQTGSGKSNLYNVIIATLIKFYAPRDIQLILCDFKEGLGFARWDGVQHLAMPVITDLGDLLNVLKRLEKLRRDRTLMMKGLADDLEEYNRRVAPERRLPRVLVIMDEFQQVSARREFRNDIINYVEQLTAKARSAGIHLVPGTQTPMADQVPNSIKNNMHVVIAGRMRTLAGSLSAFGSKDAMDLANIPGRMLLEDGANHFQIQVPYCSESNIRESLLAAAAWSAYELTLPELDEADAPPVFDEAVMIAYVIDHAGGRLSTRAVYPFAAEFGISRARLTKMVDATIAQIRANGERVEHGGTTYALQRAARGWMLQSSDDARVSYSGESAAD